MILALSIAAYVLAGLATAFVTALALGMAAVPGTIGGYLGFVQRCGTTTVGMAFTCLAIVALWPLHLILIAVEMRS